jgi:imidazole glycerol-phosphate synthase subunit HisH
VSETPTGRTRRPTAAVFRVGVSQALTTPVTAESRGGSTRARAISARVRVALCDVGLGNLRSVERALREGARGLGTARTTIEVTRDPDRVRTADKVVMPGQSAFGDYARALSGELGQAIREHLVARRPYLGICMGLQALFQTSEEAPGARGLGVLEGRVLKLRGGTDPSTGAPLKIPHVGWNEAEATDNLGLLAPGDALHFYFVHSFVVAPTDPRVVAATTEYGERFVSAIAFENMFACQFHPEKSQRAGLALLERFLAS